MAGRSIVGPMGLGITELFRLGRAHSRARRPWGTLPKSPNGTRCQSGSHSYYQGKSRGHANSSEECCLAMCLDRPGGAVNAENRGRHMEHELYKGHCRGEHIPNCDGEFFNVVSDD